MDILTETVLMIVVVLEVLVVIVEVHLNIVMNIILPLLDILEGVHPEEENDLLIMTTIEDTDRKLLFLKTLTFFRYSLYKTVEI